MRAGAASSSPSAVAASAAQAVLVGLDGKPPCVVRTVQTLEAEHGQLPEFRLSSGHLVVKTGGTDLESFARFFTYGFYKRGEGSAPVLHVRCRVGACNATIKIEFVRDDKPVIVFSDAKDHLANKHNIVDADSLEKILARPAPASGKRKAADKIDEPAAEPQSALAPSPRLCHRHVGQGRRPRRAAAAHRAQRRHIVHCQRAQVGHAAGREHDPQARQGAGPGGDKGEVRGAQGGPRQGRLERQLVRPHGQRHRWS